MNLRLTPDCGFSGDELTVGAWGEWPEHPGYAGRFVVADIDGSGGHPWVCVEPGIGYGSGVVGSEHRLGPHQLHGVRLLRQHLDAHAQLYVGSCEVVVSVEIRSGFRRGPRSGFHSGLTRIWVPLIWAA